MEAVETRSRFLITTRRGDETKFLLLKRRRSAPEEEPESDRDPGQAAHTEP